MAPNAVTTADVSQANTFLSRLYGLTDEREEDNAIELIYGYFYDLRMKEDLPPCDEVLALVDVSRLSPVLLTAILTITAAVKNKLSQRVTFYQAAKEAIEAVHGIEETKDILVGLE